jgi:AIG2-like family.
MLFILFFFENERRQTTFLCDMITKVLKPNHCFVYGTLMAPEVLTTLIDRVPDNIAPAFLPPEYSRHPVIGQVYPGVTAAREDKVKQPTISSCEQENPYYLEIWNDVKSSCVSGVLLSGLNDRELKVLDWFEDVDYTRTTIPVLLDKDGILEKIDADVYIWSAGEELLNLDSPWDYNVFRAEQLTDYLKLTVVPCRMECDRLFR